MKQIEPLRLVKNEENEAHQIPIIEKNVYAHTSIIVGMGKERNPKEMLKHVFNQGCSIQNKRNSWNLKKKQKFLLPILIKGKISIISLVKGSIFSLFSTSLTVRKSENHTEQKVIV
jgi:hypothetical protein